MRNFAVSLLLAFLFIAPCQQAVAQGRTLYAQNFELYPQVNFTYPWNAVNGPNAFPWRCDVPYIVWPGFIDFENKTKTALTASNGVDDDVLLVTPSLNIAGMQDAYLSYDSYFQKLVSGGKSESARVEFSTDGGSTWTVAAPAPVSKAHMRRSYVSLAGANGSAGIKIGFRYSDSNQLQFGWIVDNIRVFLPAQNDIGIIHAGPEDSMMSYYAVPASVPLQGTVMNWGKTPITAFDVYYQEAGGAVQSYSVTGVNIAPFDTFNFTHSVPLGINAIGAHKARMWAVAAGDTTHSNDTMTATIRGAAFMPAKKLVIEEGTGTWNEFSPRYNVYLHALDASDNPPTRISVHSADVMAVTPYADFLYFLNQNLTPYFVFDRRETVPYSSFFSKADLQKDYFGFADIGIKAAFNGSRLEAEVSVTQALDLAGRHCLALVVTEDGVSGSSPYYAQANHWAGGVYGPMGGFESLPNPVPAGSMKYDYVARSINPAPEGDGTCLPLSMKAGKAYTCNLQAVLSNAWNFSQLKAAILLIRDKDSAVLNSKSVLISTLGVPAISGKPIHAILHPNPAADVATISFSLPSSTATDICVVDFTRRMVYEQHTAILATGTHEHRIPTAGWAAGIYFVTLRCGDTQQTLKLSVLH